jgi:putative ABC transport system substrate-binding protein
MKRREFIAGLGGAAAWPLAARAQQPNRMRRIGVLLPYDESDPEPKTYLSAFVRGLAELGWTDGRDMRMDIRWAAGNVERMRIFAKELIELQPDVMLSDGTPASAALQHETRTIPIVFAPVADPVGSGFVASLPRPSGNMTGFSDGEASMAGKWLELLKEIAPGVKRAAFMFNPVTAPYIGSYFRAPFEAAARSLKVAPIAAPVHSDAEIETVITSLGREPGGGLVVMPDTFMVVHRAPIIMLAARNNVPAVYWKPVNVKDGGLLSYGPNVPDIYRRSASYVDRILRGEKPADLPVQLPIKFDTAINLKTAKALGLTVPQSILLRADDVIE